MTAPSSWRSLSCHRTGLILVVLAFTAAANAQFTPSDDADTNSAKPTTNYGIAGTVNVQNGTQIQTGFFRFDLSSIPSTFGPNIAKATLKLHVASVTTGGSFNVDYVLGPWSEKTITANLSPALGTTIVGPVAVTTALNGDYLLIDITPAAVNWVENPSQNYGIALVANSPLNAAVDSKENTATSHSAELDIVFNGPPGPQGPQGAQGPQGPAGPPGPAGAPGATGATGPMGAQGPAGPMGLTGAQGPTGPAGPQGPAGPSGITNRGSWVPTTAYQINDSVSYNGASWIALMPNMDSPPNETNVNWQLLAAKGINNQGEWVSTVNYEVDDAVTSGGQFWIAVAPSVGSQPSDTNANWQLIAAAGAPGAAGPTGSQGPAGATGSQGPAGPQGPTGPAGPQGVSGPTGPQGPQGPAGPTGPQGPSGTSTARMFFSAFMPGNLTNTRSSVAEVIPDSDITITRITASLQTSGGVACLPAVVRVADATSGQDLTLASPSNADTGPMALLLPAGDTVNVQLQTGASCGAATNPADANVEVQYKMRETTDTQTCAGGGTACNGVCEILTANAYNCGTCGNACPSGQACNNGSCGSVCGTGFIVCGNSCANVSTDPNNCGTCGNACPSGQSCVSGACTTSCTGGSQPLCGGSCQTIHSNGLGQSYYDCNALGTYNVTTATEAATAFSATALMTQLACTGGGSNLVIAAQTGVACATWDYSGTEVGHVHLNSSSTACFCPGTSDPGWN
jgi:collagen triple helix repeat protein/stigma-specific protein Stig1